MKHKFDEIPISDKLDSVIQGSMKELHVEHRRKVLKKSIMICSLVVVMMAGGIVWGFSNPVLASNIPIIGKLFEKTEEKVAYKGKYSEKAAVLEENAEEKKYTQTANGITVSVSEVYCDGRGLYLSMEIENEVPFPDYYSSVRTMDGYAWDYDRLELDGTTEIDGKSSNNLEQIEGTFETMNKFTGIICVDISGENVPEKFTYSVEIENIWKFEGRQPVDKDLQKGPWKFEIPVKKDLSDTIVKEIHQTNENGYGIGVVEKTRYEIGATVLKPQEDQDTEYHVVMFDADGKLLDYHKFDIYSYNIYNRDVSKVYLYLVNTDEYLGGGKANPQEYVKEHALYSTVVEF